MLYVPSAPEFCHGDTNRDGILNMAIGEPQNKKNRESGLVGDDVGLKHSVSAARRSGVRSPSPPNFFGLHGASLR